ncbi:MAG TPA: hypothetical protein VLH58_02880 [Candidatus Methylomirabilis sp.]|nr:hypothetical protein [Candidatus Methylomirabilis sp.]HSD49939.1 hypothetical protein [Candidatus Methylomirabilis sp.]
MDPCPYHDGRDLVDTLPPPRHLVPAVVFFVLGDVADSAFLLRDAPAAYRRMDQGKHSRKIILFP